MNVLHLNHPKTILPVPGPGKIVFHETSPWCQKTGDRCSQEMAWFELPFVGHLLMVSLLCLVLV